MIRCLVLFFLILYAPNLWSYEFIRDSEIESVIKKLTKPIFLAAKIDQDSVKVFIVKNKELNAYIMDNNHIFIHSGLLTKSQDPHMILGVLAHEIGHIAAGHSLGREANYNDSMLSAGIGYILGIISAITISPEVGSAVILSGMHIGERVYLRHSRANEDIADQYALQYLDQSGYSNKGMQELFSLFYRNEFGHNINQYAITHPLSKARLLNVQNYKITKKINDLSHDDLDEFARAVVKLDAFISPLPQVTARYSDDSLVSNYAKVIYYYRKSDLPQSMETLNSLIAKLPNDPYLYELKAQVFYKMGKMTEAVENYEKALELSHDDFLLKFELTQSLILYDQKKAITYLEQLISVEPNNSFFWWQISSAYKAQGNLGMCYFALAKRYWLEGDVENFKRYSELAAKSLPPTNSYAVMIKDMSNQMHTRSNRSNH